MNLLYKYLKYWYLFLISIVICLLIAPIIIYFTTPYYLVSTTLLLEDDKKGEGVLKESAFSDLNMFHTTKSIENEMQVLRSVNLFKKVLNKLSIHTRCYLMGEFTNKEVYGKSSPLFIDVHKISPSAYLEKVKVNILDDSKFELVTFKGDLAHIYHFGDRIITPYFIITINKGAAFKGKQDNISFSFINVDELAKRYRDSKLEINTMVKDANVLQLSLYDNVPERGVNILTQLVKEYNLEDVTNKNQMAIATINFIDTRLKYLTNDLGNVERNVQQYKQLNRVTNIAADAQSNLQRAEEYKQQLEAINVQLGILNAINIYLNNSGKLLPIVPGTAGLQDGSLLVLINKYNDVQENYQHLLNGNQPNNPLVINAKDKLNVIRQNITANLSSIKNNLLINKNNLMMNSSKFESRIKTSPAIEKGLQERDREQAVKANLFQYLIQKREETALSLSANVPDAKIIDAANYDSEPAKPKKQLIYLYAFLFGLIIPVSYIYVKDMFNSKIDSAEQIALQTNVKILGELCHAKSNEVLAINGKYRNNITELFRYIRNNLRHHDLEDRNQVLLITSSIQGEGKTFTSINLGATLSNIDKRVVILEFDLRKPDLISKMGLDKSLGITDYLNSDFISIDDIINPSGIAPNLFVIGCGTLVADPGNEMMKPKISLLFERLRSRFDYIIIDTSPIALVADAFSLDAHSDATIYIMRYNYTQKSHLNILVDIEKNNKLKNLMVILNDGKVDHLKNYGYGSTVYA
ncbi:polysaccharide biosynthesis tyrosine autokinase [Pedobacter sp. ASV28]|jgi:tyrosine-protein kinase Etk/Wzc|uniref:GumC family protein n=1 Tax=Pedobacter sp. ASV28 TaxID=2795123 RepID=UPI0018EDAF32|nr:polysaccharide biosynthesis tyrosine autokinase [Pedobacter sp. ASV28]